MKVFGDFACNPENVRAVAVTTDMRGGGFSGPRKVAQVILESGETVSVSPEAAELLINYFEASEKRKGGNQS